MRYIMINKYAITGKVIEGAKDNLPLTVRVVAHAGAFFSPTEVVKMTATVGISVSKVDSAQFSPLRRERLMFLTAPSSNASRRLVASPRELEDLSQFTRRRMFDDHEMNYWADHGWMKTSPSSQKVFDFSSWTPRDQAHLGRPVGATAGEVARWRDAGYPSAPREFLH